MSVWGKSADQNPVVLIRSMNQWNTAASGLHVGSVLQFRPMNISGLRGQVRILK
jgi:hypothetical protein